MSVLSAPFDKNTTSFAIPNGSYSSAQKRILEKLSEQSQFNFEQYQVEHATPKRILSFVLVPVLEKPIP